MSDAPQVLLAHHLKTLKLPTFLREYDKIARQCATEDVDHVRYLLRLAEMSTAEQNRSKGRRKTGPFSVMRYAVLRVVPLVHRRAPRCFA